MYIVYFFNLTPEIANPTIPVILITLHHTPKQKQVNPAQILPSIGL